MFIDVSNRGYGSPANNFCINDDMIIILRYLLITVLHVRAIHDLTF